MGSLRRRALITVVAGSLASAVTSGVTPAHAQEEPAAVLTPPGQGELARDFGEDRASHTIVLLLDSDKAIDAAPSVAVPDAHTSKGRPLDGSLTVTAELVGGKTVRVPVVVDPADGADPDTYQATVRFRGPEIANLDVPVSVSLSRDPSEELAWVLAFVAVLLGAAFGGGLRWLAEKGSKLHDLLGRYESLDALTLRRHPFPDGFSRELLELHLMLERGDVVRAEPKLATLETALPKLLSALDALDAAFVQLPEQQERIRQMADTTFEGRLLAVVETQRRELEKAVADSWPDTDQSKGTRDKAASTVDSYSSFLDHYKAPGSRSGAEFEEALTFYELGEAEKAEQKWAPVRQAAAAAGDQEAPAGAADAKQGKGRRKRLSMGPLVRHVPFLVGLATTLGLALVGLVTVFKVDTMFLTDDISDFLLLLAWGFGSALAGVTITQLAAKVPSPSSTTT